MRIAELIPRWGAEPQPAADTRTVWLRLPLHDAARIEALRVMYPGCDGSQLMADLLRAALDELEDAMPYVPGDTVIAEDDRGAPIYEDMGPTPRFYALAREIQRLLADSPQLKTY